VAVIVNLHHDENIFVFDFYAWRLHPKRSVSGHVGDVVTSRGDAARLKRVLPDQQIESSSRSVTSTKQQSLG
jgi:hypothetical protein